MVRTARSVGVLIAAIAAIVPATSVFAAPAAAPAFWVNGSGTVGTDTSCSNPGFTTISAALLAVPSGAVINVCSTASPYNEQLVITKAVTLRANGAVTVTGPAVPSDTATSCDADGPNNQDEVDICVPGKVVITGFTIEGGFAQAYCNDDFYGIAVLGGATLNMSQSVVENVGGPNPGGCQGGIGIQIGEAISATAADAGHAILTGDTIETYQKGGLTVDGVGSTATITNVNVVGSGPAPIAQNGIQISDGAKATISGAVVTGNECNLAEPTCGPNADADAQSTGILLFDAGTTTVKNSTVTSNDVGVYNVGDIASDFYTPPSPFNITATFTNVTMSNRYENSVADSGKTIINGSHMSGGETGLTVFQYNGQPIGATFTGSHDTITGASTAAVNVDSDGGASDFPVAVSITNSSFNLSNAAGVRNATSEVPSVVHATDDWWGNNTGPSLWSFGTGSSVSAWVNFFPWALTSSVNSFKTCTTSLNASTTGNDVVLCAKATGNATLSNNGNGNVLLLGNNGNDHLNGSAANGETWIIAGQGNNVINGKNPPGTGGGFVEERGNTHDTETNLSHYTVDFD